jgi:hypothetical protein
VGEQDPPQERGGAQQRGPLDGVCGAPDAPPALASHGGGEESHPCHQRGEERGPAEQRSETHEVPFFLTPSG